MTLNKSQLKTRLNRIEGQVKGVGRMIEQEEYCIDVIQQIMAIRGALKSSALLVLENHLNTCVKTAILSEDESASKEKIDELLNIYNKLGM